jgi:hypothetical protein
MEAVAYAFAEIAFFPGFFAYTDAGVPQAEENLHRGGGGAKRLFRSEKASELSADAESTDNPVSAYTR